MFSKLSLSPLTTVYPFIARMREGGKHPVRARLFLAMIWNSNIGLIIRYLRFEDYKS